MVVCSQKSSMKFINENKFFSYGNWIQEDSAYNVKQRRSREQNWDLYN